MVKITYFLFTILLPPALSSASLGGRGEREERNSVDLALYDQVLVQSNDATTVEAGQQKSLLRRLGGGGGNKNPKTIPTNRPTSPDAAVVAPAAATPTTNRPTQAPVVRTAPPAGACAAGSDYWTDPAWADKLKCTSTNDCRFSGTSNCCLVAFCMCGFYQPGQQGLDCVP